MSNTLAIAVTTAVIEARIRALFTAAGLPALAVEPRLPRGDDATDGAYVQAFRITPNASLRSLDLPTRRPDGSLVQLPRLAIDVDYAIAFASEAADYLPERMAGLVLTDFHANPFLSPEEIGEFLEGLAEGHPLRNADVGDQLERVKLTLLPMSLEDLSRAWGLGNQSWYALTVAFQASIIILDAEVQPTTSLPVHQAGIHVSASVGPRITEVRSSERAVPTVLLGATPPESLLVRGTDLRGASTWLRIGRELLEVPAEAFGVDGITLPLDAALGLRSGVTSVEVLHRVELGAPPDPWRTAAASNSVPLALLPSVSVPVSPVTVTANPEVIEIRLAPSPLPEESQDITLLLDRIGGAQPLHVSSRAVVVDGGTSQLVITMARPEPGEYLVRLRIDGTTTLVSPDGSGLLAEPRIEVPAP